MKAAATTAAAAGASASRSLHRSPFRRFCSTAAASSVPLSAHPRYAELITAANVRVDPCVCVRVEAGRGAGLYVSESGVQVGRELISLPRASAVTPPPPPAGGGGGASDFAKYRLAALLAGSGCGGEAAAADAALLEAYRRVLGDPPRNGVYLLPKHFATQRFKELCKGWRELAARLADDSACGAGEAAAAAALSHVLSRAVVVEKTPTLLPVLDLANHSFAPNATFATAGEAGGERVVLRATREMAAGDEICIVYSARRPPSSPPRGGGGGGGGRSADDDGGSSSDDSAADFWLFTWGFVPAAS